VRRGRSGASEEDPGAVHWIFKNKDHGKTAAAASLGLIALWDVEGGLPQIDKFLYSKDPHVVAGARPVRPRARAALPRGGALLAVWARPRRRAAPTCLPGLPARASAVLCQDMLLTRRTCGRPPAARPALRRTPVQAGAGLAAPHAGRASRGARAQARCWRSAC